MKSIYKILIIGMLCLLSSKTFAQFEIVKSDKQPINTGNSIYDCTCTFIEDYNTLQRLLAQLEAIEEARWLGERESVFKLEIERRLGKENNPYPNFQLAQIAWFNNMTKDPEVDNIMKSRRDTYQKSNSEFNRAKNELHYEREVTQYRLNFTTPSPNDFGDLKTNRGQGNNAIKFTDLSIAAAQENLGSLNVNLFVLEQGLNTQTELINGIDKLRQTPAILREQIINDYVNHYNSLDLNNKVKLMTKYLIAGSGASLVNAAAWLSPPHAWSVSEDQYAAFIDIWARELGESSPIAYPSETGASAIKPYSIVSLGEERSIFIKKRPNLKIEVEDYFSNSRYKQNSFDLVKQVIDSYKDNQAFNPTQGNFASVGRPVKFQNSEDKELGLSFGALPGGLKGIGNILAELFDDSKVADLKLKGAIIRRMFGDNNMLFPTTLPDELIGRMFNFRKLPWQVKPTPGASDFFVQRVDIEFAWNMGAALWNNNMRIPEVYSSPSGVSAIEALIGPAIDLFDFEHLARVYNITRTLQLNSIQEDWLANNVGKTSRINQYLQSNLVSQEAKETMRTLIILETQSNHLINPLQNDDILRTVTYYNDGVFDSDINFCGCSASNEFVREGYLKGTISEQQLFDTYGAQVNFQIQDPDGSFRAVSQLDFYLETAEIREGVIREILAWTPVGDISEAGYELYDGNYGMAAANIGLLFVPFDRVIISGGRIVKVIFRNGSEVVEFTVDQIWRMKPFARGRLIEEALAKTHYKDYLWTVDIPTANGKPNYFWPYFDFIKGNKVVSVKTTTATSGFGNIKRNILDLALYVKGNTTNGGTIINNVDLDIWVPEGYDRNLLNGIINFGEQNGINVNIFDYK